LPKDLELTGAFKDHFSTQSDGYARYRPTYPRALFEFLSSLTTSRATAMDCATGNGQAAQSLAEFYTEIVATDASQSQIDAAVRHPRITYHAVTAEQSGLADDSADLMTVGQAFHWFDEERFFREARRVLRRDGVLAIWCYESCSVSDQCDAIVDRLYREIVGDFWPRELATIEKGYSDVRLPGSVIEAPSINMNLDWSAADMLGYLRTWSACKRYEAQHESDPVALIEADLQAAWGAAQRRVVWPLEIKVSRVNRLLE
jgi:SAM-dependent methyltransferase